MSVNLRRIPGRNDPESLRLQKLTEALSPFLTPEVRRIVAAVRTDDAAIARVKWERAMTERMARLSATGGPAGPPGPPGPEFILTAIWGNYLWPDNPAPVPFIGEAELVGVNPLFIDRRSASPPFRTGTYVFDPVEEARQILWMADTLLLGSPQFLTGEDPWVLDPGDDIASWAASVDGLPGHVYITANRNSGGYSISAI